ncbi:MAG: hypothetical protein AB7J13_04265, partial [Pyrinomonadaceae bacterium]
ELEMKPGTETTVVVNLDYKGAADMTKPARIVASLNDWTITRDGRVEYFPANSQPNSASSWLLFSPGEGSVMPGSMHQIRVTVAVPANAKPGDHLAALIIEERPETLKFEENTRKMVLRYRMASVFYIKVGPLTKKGSFENLYAESSPDGILVTPVLANHGGSVIRPTATVTVVDADGKVVADAPEFEALPVLAGSESARALLIEKSLPAGKYTVKYRVDFQDGRPATVGVTDLVVPQPQIATSAPPVKIP